MKFKVGDWVHPEKDVGINRSRIKKGTNVKITKIQDKDGWFQVENISDWYNPEYWKKSVLNNSLNRKLYPNREEYNGLLLSEKVSAKLKERK